MAFVHSEFSTWDAPPRPEPAISTFHRLWLGFMAARIGIAVVLLALLATMKLLGLATVSTWQLVLCATYLGASLAVRFTSRPAFPGRTFDPQWVSTIGIDLLAFSALHFMHTAGLNYSPLYALPVLTGAVLGSLLARRAGWPLAGAVLGTVGFFGASILACAAVLVGLLALLPALL